MKKIWLALPLAAAILPAAAQDPLHIRGLAATCANCHGTEGRTVDGSAVPSIAAMPKEYMMRQLRAFRDGSRPASVMDQIAKGFTEAQLDQIATYFSNQKR